MLIWFTSLPAWIIDHSLALTALTGLGATMAFSVMINVLAWRKGR
jgi:hypothetical protein